MKVNRSSLSEQVKDSILERIVKGRYKPGERLVELAIAKEFDISQVTVREAFSKLEAMSFLESKPHRGTFVREISDQEMGESTMVRGVLEEAAAIKGGQVLKGRVAELRAEVKGMMDAFEKKDLDGVAEHNVNFHRMIVQATENSILIKVWESLAFEAKSRLCANRAAQAVVLMGIKSCQPIIDAFERGDGETAGRLLRQQSEKCGMAQVTASTRITSEEFQKALAAATGHALQK
jgi:DNA-binding GntR family transcriptional regulator